MTRQPRSRTAILAALTLLAMMVACRTRFLGPTPPPYDLGGLTFDDTGWLPDHDITRLPGVRVEVLDGPKAGTSAISDGTGTYVLRDFPGGPVQMRATKEGYDDSEVLTYSVESFQGPIFTLGQPPHTLWGDVFLRGTQTTLANASVEIIDGPNAGKVTVSNESGRYRFDDLVASPLFQIRIAKTGYQTDTFNVFDLRAFRHNQRRNVSLAGN